MRKTLTKIQITALLIIPFYSINGSAYEIAFDETSFNWSKRAIEVKKRMVSAYKDIGLNVDIKNKPTIRNFSENMKGKSDGDFARALRVIKIHKLLYVPVPIMNIKICAYANRSVNKPIKQAYVVYQRGILVLDTMKFQRSELLNSSSQVLEFYNKRKQVDYFLGANMFFGDLLSKQKFKDFKCKIILFEIPVYHVVAEKNKHLIPELTESFKSYFPYNGDLRNSKSEKAR